MPENSGHFSALFIELGLIIAGLAVLARLAKRYGISAIPLYLLAGLAFGKGGLTPLHVSEQFTRIGAANVPRRIIEKRRSARESAMIASIDWGLKMTCSLLIC